MRSWRPGMRHAGQLALGALGLLAAAPAWPSTATGTIAVSARVEQSCHLDVRPLRFDALRSGAPGADADSSLAVACTPDTAFVVTMDDGRNRSGGARRMADAGGGRFLAYEIYSDAARTRRWGASLAEAVSGWIDGATPVTLPIYGRIEAASATAGAYSDVVTVTVSF